MSLMHNFIQMIIRKGHKPYDPSNPPNYQLRREAEEKRFKKLPKDLTVEEIKEEDITGEYIKKVGNDEKKIILYIHGGGFVGGSAKARRDITFYLARHSGFNVMAINYPLAPEVKFPRPVEVCFKAYCSLVNKFGAKNICVMGESAGGNLVLASLLMAKNNKIDLPSSICVFSPATILGKQMPSYHQNGHKDAMLDENSNLEILDMYFSSKEDCENIYASPLYGDYHNFPPILLFASDSEVLMDDSTLLNQKLIEHNVDVTFILSHNLMHAYVTMPYFPEAIKGLKKTISFLQEHFEK